MYIKIDSDVIIIEAIKKQSSNLFEKSFQEKLTHLETSLSLLIQLKSSIGYKKTFLQWLQAPNKFYFTKKYKLNKIKDNVDTYYQYPMPDNIGLQRLEPYRKILSGNLPNISLPDLTREELKFYNLLVAFQGINDINIFNSDYLESIIKQINLRVNAQQAYAIQKKAKEIEKDIKNQEKDIFNYISKNKTIRAETVIMKYIKLIENKIEFEIKRIKIEKIIHYDRITSNLSNTFIILWIGGIILTIIYLAIKLIHIDLGSQIPNSYIFISSLLGTMLWSISYFSRYILLRFRQNIKMVLKLLEGLIVSGVIFLLLSNKTSSHWYLLLAFSVGFSSSAALLVVKIMMKHLFLSFNGIILKKSKGKYNYEKAITHIFDLVIS